MGGYLVAFRNNQFFEIVIFFQVYLEIEEGNETNQKFKFRKRKNFKQTVVNSSQIFEDTINLFYYTYDLWNNFYLAICDEGEYYIFYWFQYVDEFRPNYIYKLDKNRNCEDRFTMHDQYNIIFLERLNSSDWVVFKLENLTISILFEPSQFNFSILQSLFQRNNEMYLIFVESRQVLKNLLFSQFEIIYQNQEKKILYYYSLYLFDLENMMIFKDSFNNQNEIQNKTLFIYRSQITKTILKTKYEIFIIFDDFFQIFQNNTMNELPLKFDSLGNSHYPYLFGINKGIIDIYRLNFLNPFLFCNQLFQTQSEQIQVNLNQIIIWKDQNYQSKNQSYLFNKAFSISVSDINWQFKIECPVAVESVIPKFQFENNQVKCVQQDSKVQDCLNLKLDFFWSRHIIIENQLFVIYQSIQQKLFIQNCTNQNLSYIGAIERINFENIFVYSTQIILINSEGKKAIVIDITNYSNINIKQYEFKEEIMNIVSIKNWFYFVFSNCDVSFFGKQQFSYFGQVGLSKSFQKCDKLTVYNNYKLLKFNSKQLILITFHYIKKINYKDGSIKKLIIFEQSDTEFIMLVEKDNQNIFLKYSIFEDNLIQNFQLPTYNFKYIFPINYICNEQYLIVAAFNQEQNFLLIYDMNNQKQNILVDIVENIELNNFSFIDKSTLIYYRQNQLYQKVLSKLIFSCQIQDILMEFQKYIQLQISMKSKIFEYPPQKGELIILIKNFIPNLFHKNSTEINFLNQLEDFYFDPRLYIVGPIASISSQDYDIQSPFKLIMTRKIVDCSQIKNNICIDKANKKVFDHFQNKLITNYDFQDNINIISISNDYIIISKNINGQQVIQFLSFQFEVLYEEEINNSHNSIQAICFKNYIFVISKSIMIYKLDKNITLLQKFEFLCSFCKIMKSSKEENVFLIYSNLLPYIIIRYLKIDNDTNQVNQNIVKLHFENLKFVNESYFYIVSLDKFDRYHFSKMLIYNSESTLYIIELKLFDDLYEYRVEKQIGVVRLFNGSNHVQLYFLTENIFFYQFQNKLYLYNISRSEDFEFIDYIHSINAQYIELQIINCSHFLVIDYNNQNFSLYKLQPYKLHLKNKQQFETSILFQNDVSQIQLYIEYQYPKNENFKYLQLICTTIIICIILCIITKFIKYKKIKQNLNETQQEIEM